MQSILKKQYLIILIPAICLFLFLGLAKELNFIKPGQFVIPSVLQSMVFILSTLSALAGPLFLRTVFVYSMREKKQISAADFLSFQRKILWISQITSYWAFTAVLGEFPKFYAAAIVLMALYATYYYFPSSKRIDFDRKIFRVK